METSRIDAVFDLRPQEILKKFKLKPSQINSKLKQISRIKALEKYMDMKSWGENPRTIREWLTKAITLCQEENVDPYLQDRLIEGTALSIMKGFTVYSSDLSLNTIMDKVEESVGSSE